MARRGGAAHKGKAARKKIAPKRGVGVAKSVSAPATASATAIAFSVHVFTALGAACAILALIAATRAEWVAMFAWLGVALVIDGVDGTLARHFRVAELLPRWSGDALDLVVDFTTYVLVPAYALFASGLLPQTLAVPLSIAIVVSAAIYCADRKMKLPDNSFRGFPILWNAHCVSSVRYQVFALGHGGDRRGFCDPDLRAIPDHSSLAYAADADPQCAGSSCLGCARSLCTRVRPQSGTMVRGRARRHRGLFSRRGSPSSRDAGQPGAIDVGIVDRPARMGRARHPDGARNRARHRQYRLHFGAGRPMQREAGAARAPDRIVAGFHLPDHPARRPDLDHEADRAGVRALRLRLLMARHHPDRRRSVPDRKGRA